MKYKLNANNIWTMCFMLFFSQQPRLTAMFCFTHWLCLVAMRKNSTILFCVKISLSRFFIITMDVLLNGFWSMIMNWSAFKPYCLSFLARQSLRHDLMHNFLSAYFYIQNFKRFTFSTVLKYCCRYESDW